MYAITINERRDFEGKWCVGRFGGRKSRKNCKYIIILKISIS